MLQARRAKRCGECRLDFETTLVARRHLDTGRGRWVIRACGPCAAKLAAKYADGSVTLTRIAGLATSTVPATLGVEVRRRDHDRD